MKNQKGMTLVDITIIIAIIILCIILIPNLNLSSKTERIAKETQQMLIDDWRQKGMNVTVIEDMIITKKQKNEYSGLIKIRYQGRTIQLTGTVICDGRSIQWQPDTQNLLYQFL